MKRLIPLVVLLFLLAGTISAQTIITNNGGQPTDLTVTAGGTGFVDFNFTAGTFGWELQSPDGTWFGAVCTLAGESVVYTSMTTRTVTYNFGPEPWGPGSCSSSNAGLTYSGQSVQNQACHLNVRYHTCSSWSFVGGTTTINPTFVFQ